MTNEDCGGSAEKKVIVVGTENEQNCERRGTSFGDFFHAYHTIIFLSLIFKKNQSRCVMLKELSVCIDKCSSAVIS